MHGYEFLRHVRSTPSHETFVARVATTGSLVVIKVYALAYLRRNELRRHMTESSLLVARRVQHAFIAELLGAFASRYDLFVVERFYEEGELYEWMESCAATAEGGALPAEAAPHLLRQIMQALQYLHEECGLCHRNLKLENILLDEGCNVRLGGLGMCAVLTPASSSPPHKGTDGTLQLCCGAKHYVAPELIQGVPYDGREVDVWAAGVVLFALLTGSFPFDAVDGDQLFEIIAQGETSLVANPAYTSIDDPLAKDLLQDMLRTDPTVRLSVAEVLEHPYLKV